MKILSIETSCDETAAAVIKGDGKNAPEIVSNVVVSQIDIFREYGGVIPEVAARSHLEVVLPVIHRALNDAKTSLAEIDAIAVTHTPGLLGPLLIGTLTARTLAILQKKPFYPVHHLKSHIYANWLQRENLPEFPLLALVISGGHTQIIRMTAHERFEIIGTTRDDAVGECFDKVAKILGLPYPGGPSIAKAAKEGNPAAYAFPHPKLSASLHLQTPPKNGITEGVLDFSFSGLKTAVLRSVQQELGKPVSFPSHELAPLLNSKQVADFATSFQKTAVDILLEKMAEAVRMFPDTRSICFAGGVSANEALRNAALKTFTKTKVYFPKPALSGDNGAMVGAAAYYEIISGVPPSDPYQLTLMPRSPIQ